MKRTEKLIPPIYSYVGKITQIRVVNVIFIESIVCLKRKNYRDSVSSVINGLSFKLVVRFQTDITTGPCPLIEK